MFFSWFKDFKDSFSGQNVKRTENDLFCLCYLWYSSFLCDNLYDGSVNMAVLKLTSI